MAPKVKKPDDDDGDDAPTISDEMRTEIGNMINGSIKDHLKRTLGPAIRSSLDPVLLEIKALTAKRAAPADADDDTEDQGEEPDPDERPAKVKGGKQSPAPVDTKAEAKAQRELKAMRAKVEAMDAERKLEREQLQAGQRDSSLRELLVKGNVKPELMRGAMLALRETTKRDDKTGEWTFVAKRDGFDEELDLAAGVDGWLKSDEGKAHVAAPTQPARSGSGMPRINGPTAAPALGRTQPAADPKHARAAAMADADAELTSALTALASGATLV